MTDLAPVWVTAIAALITAVAALLTAVRAHRKISGRDS